MADSVLEEVPEMPEEGKGFDWQKWLGYLLIPVVMLIFNYGGDHNGMQEMRNSLASQAAKIDKLEQTVQELSKAVYTMQGKVDLQAAGQQQDRLYRTGGGGR